MTVLLWAISQISPTSQIHHPSKFMKAVSWRVKSLAQFSSFTRRDTGFLTCPGLARIFIQYFFFFLFLLSMSCLQQSRLFSLFSVSQVLLFCAILQVILHHSWQLSAMLVWWIYLPSTYLCTNVHSLVSHDRIGAQILQQCAGGKWE